MRHRHCVFLRGVLFADAMTVDDEAITSDSKPSNMHGDGGCDKRKFDGALCRASE